MTWRETKSYMICTTARSGSNLLCNVLRNTKQLGFPVEALNPDFARSSAFFTMNLENEVVDPSKFIEWIKLHHHTKNGVFGTKILHEDFQAYRGFHAFRDLFLSSKIIHLRRRSKRSQAISYFFASETGQWVATDTPKKSIDTVQYDFNLIRRHYHRLTQQDADWTVVLTSLKIAYLEVFFEDFVADMPAMIDRIVSYLEVDAVSPNIKVDLQEQASPRSKAFAERFSEDYRNFLFSDTESVEYKGLRIVSTVSDKIL